MSRTSLRSSRRRCSRARAPPAGRLTSWSRSGSAGRSGRRRGMSAHAPAAAGSLRWICRRPRRSPTSMRRRGSSESCATLRGEWGDEIEASARDADYRVRAVAYRSIAQFRFRQKLELLRRGLEDESPAVRGSALIALEGLSRSHPATSTPIGRSSTSRIAGPERRGAATRHRLLQERHSRAGDDRDPRRHRGRRRGRPRGEEDGSIGVAAPRQEGKHEIVVVMSSPLVGLIMGSRSDWETMRHAAETLEALGVPFEQRVVSAHRTPDLLFEYAGVGGGARAPGARSPAPAARRTCRAWRPRRRRCRCSACRSSRRRSRGWTRCSRSCRCRPASRSGRSRSVARAP